MAFNDNAALIWQKVASIEKQIDEETRRQRERMAELKTERDRLLLKLLEAEGAPERRYAAA